MNSNFWWLSINPKMLRFRDLEIGDKFYYIALNEDGSKRTLYKNFAEAKKGDLVIVYEADPAKEVIGLCVVEEEIKDDKVLFKKVEALTDAVARYDIERHIELANLEVFRYTQGTLFKLAPREFNVIYSMMRELNPKKQYRIYDEYNKQKFLEEVFFDEQEYDELRNLILKMKNVILQGVPGVGKTYIAKKMAYSILGKKDEDKILALQFHETFSNDEFIEGYRPDDIGIYKYRRGAFKKMCTKARNNPKNKYFVIIDEINRANISKVFGEAFSLIEVDKRGKENFVELACSRERFYVPQNIYIIGTMNTYDENLLIKDYALRRRFCFYDIKPAFDNMSFKKFCEKNELLLKVVDSVKQINKMIVGNTQIGHSYFCHHMDDENIKMIVKYNIMPLVREYFRKDEVCQTKAISILEEAIK